MRHKRNGRKLGRTSAHRKALNRNLTRSLILHGRIKTTVAKAKEMIPFASKLVTLAKEGSLAARRRAIELMGESEAVGKLFAEIAPKFSERNGGYIRMIKLPVGRLGDRAKEAFVEFVEEEIAESEEPAKKRRKRKKLSKKARRELAKKERRKYDLEKERAKAKEETEEMKAAEEEKESEKENGEKGPDASAAEEPKKPAEPESAGENEQASEPNASGKTG